MTAPSLLDELEALIELITDYPDTPLNGVLIAQRCSTFIRTNRATLVAMAKRLEAAERDGKRWRWLCSEKVYWVEIQSQPSADCVYRGHVEKETLCKNVDAAIDASTQEVEG